MLVYQRVLVVTGYFYGKKTFHKWGCKYLELVFRAISKQYLILTMTLWGIMRLEFEIKSQDSVYYPLVI